MLTSSDHRVLDFGFHRVRPAVVARLALERAMRFPMLFSKPGCEGCAHHLVEDVSPHRSVERRHLIRHRRLDWRLRPQSRFHRRRVIGALPCWPARPGLQRSLARHGAAGADAAWRFVRYHRARHWPALHRSATSANILVATIPTAMPATRTRRREPDPASPSQSARFAGLAHEPTRPRPTVPRRRWRPAARAV